MKIKLFAVLAASQLSLVSVAGEATTDNQRLSFDQLKAKCASRVENQAMVFSTDIICKGKKTFWRVKGERIKEYQTTTTITAELGLKGNETTSGYNGSTVNAPYAQSCQVMEKWEALHSTTRPDLSCADLQKATSEEELCKPVVQPKTDACQRDINKLLAGSDVKKLSGLCEFRPYKDEQGNPVVKGCDGRDVGGQKELSTSESEDSSSDMDDTEKAALAKDFEGIDALKIKLDVQDKGGWDWKRPFRKSHKRYKTILVEEVPADSVLWKAGVVPGDRIRQFSGEGLNHHFKDEADFKKALKKKVKNKEEINFVLERNGNQFITGKPAAQEPNKVEEPAKEETKPVEGAPVEGVPAPTPVVEAPAQEPAKA